METWYSFYLYLLIMVAFLVQSPALRAGGGPPAEGDRTYPGGSSPVWSELHFGAGNIVGSVSTTLELSDLPMAALNASPYAALENIQFQIAPDSLKLLAVSGRAKTLVGGGSETTGKVWFDPRTGAVLQRDRIRPGKKGVRKIYRFARDGALRIRTEPGDRDEARGSPDDWSRIKESFYAYDLAATNCRFVSDPALLLYFISLAEFPVQGEQHKYCMFVDGALYEVRLEPAGTESLELDYTLEQQGVEREVNGNRNVAALALQVKPLTKGADRKEFELLELRGDITLFVDEVDRLPVQIRGQRRGIGELSVKLQHAELRSSS